MSQSRKASLVEAFMQPFVGYFVALAQALGLRAEALLRNVGKKRDDEPQIIRSMPLRLPPAEG